jgi:hypothetical protein
MLSAAESGHIMPASSHMVLQGTHISKAHIHRLQLSASRLQAVYFTPAMNTGHCWGEGEEGDGNAKL